MRIQRVPRFHVAWTLSLAAAVVLCASAASAQQPVLDASCTAAITLNFDPPARLVLPPTPAPHATVTGGGAVTDCAVLEGPTMGTVTYSLEGNLTCTSAANVTGTLDIVWTDDTESHAEVTTFLLGLGSVGGTAGLTATVTSGRFAGDQIEIVNLRDPLALVHCALTGLSRATGTASITFIQPL